MSYLLMREGDKDKQETTTVVELGLSPSQVMDLIGGKKVYATIFVYDKDGTEAEETRDATPEERSVTVYINTIPSDAFINKEGSQ